MPLSVTVVIPAYNEEQAIADVVRGARAAQPDCEILVVNDGSTDATAQRAAEAGARVIDHRKNKGYGASLATGVRAAESDVVVFMDADGQHDPADIARLLGRIEDNDMVVGARTKASHVDFNRRPGKKVLSAFANYLARERIPDVNSGLRAMRRDVLLKYLHLMPKGFSFSTTSTFAMLKSDHRIEWVPIEARKRQGTSTVRQIRHGPMTLMLMLRLTVLFDPLRVFLPISGLLMLLAAVMTTINLVFYRLAIPATAIFLGISSVIVFMMGLLTDQVSAIRREAHDRV